VCHTWSERYSTQGSRTTTVVKTSTELHSEWIYLCKTFWQEDWHVLPICRNRNSSPSRKKQMCLVNDTSETLLSWTTLPVHIEKLVSVLVLVHICNSWWLYTRQKLTIKKIYSESMEMTINIIHLTPSHLWLLLLVRLGNYLVNLWDFYSYRFIGKLTAFLQFHEFSFRNKTVDFSTSTTRCSPHNS
jgi:hypothetical protein